MNSHLQSGDRLIATDRAPDRRLVRSGARRPGGRNSAPALRRGLDRLSLVSHASVDLHPDLMEIYAWSRHPSAGYYKHPPLGALMAAAWFAVFPAADWSFHLLAMVNAAIALFAVDRIARLYLSGDKRLLVLLLLLLTPFYQFHGQRFASNQVLLSTWPIATYCFLRAFAARAACGRLAAGVAAAAGDARQVFFDLSGCGVHRGRDRAAPGALDLSAVAVAVDLGGRRPGRAGAASALADHRRVHAFRLCLRWRTAAPRERR